MNSPLKVCLVSALAVTAAASLLQARGLLGESYAEANVAYTNVDLEDVDLDVDGWAAGVDVNLPVMEARENEFGADVLLSYLYRTVDGDEGGLSYSVDEQQIFGDAVGYFDMGQFKPFAYAGLGWSFGEAEIDGIGSAEDDAWGFRFGVGVEVGLTDTISVQPYAEYIWFDYEDSDDSWTIGIDSNLWVTDQVGVGAYFEYTTEGDVSIMTAGGAVRYGW